MESKKLKAKDLINVGIYTAIYLVIFFVVGMLNAIPVLYPFLYILIPLISGIPFMLFLTKTDKFGMVTIMSVICGVFWFLMGYTWTAIVGYVVFGIIADLVLQILSFVAQSERENIRKRQAEGIAAAKARGVKFSRPPVPLPGNFYEVHRAWRGKKMTLRQAAEACGMPEGTFYAKAVKFEKAD